MSQAIHVLIVEDDPRIADAICAILTHAGFADLGVAKTAERAERAVKARPPDLVLVDLGLPDRDGVELIRALRAGSFRAPVLVLTSATDPERVLSALHAGGDGYLFKEDIDARLAVSLRELLKGGTPLSAGAAKAVVSELRASERPPAKPPLAPVLSPRERGVLEQLATGASYAEIARELCIEVNTVRSHVRSLYEKCGVENRAEAVNLGWSLGLLQRSH